jgi:hypothetical protein
MAKPKVDLSDLRVRTAMDAHQMQAKMAVELVARKDAAVRPIYALNARTNRVEHEGSCVLLAVADQVFALSASHIFDAIREYALLIGCGTRLHTLEGDRFSTARGRSGTHRHDPIDASVFHIGTEIPDEVRACALSIADLDLVAADRAREFYVASGYRISKSGSTAKGHTARLDGFPSVELDLDHYQHWPLERNWYLLLVKGAVNYMDRTRPLRMMANGAEVIIDVGKRNVLSLVVVRELFVDMYDEYSRALFGFFDDIGLPCLALDYGELHQYTTFCRDEASFLSAYFQVFDKASELGSFPRLRFGMRDVEGLQRNQDRMCLERD